jgi:outer membrane protein assembly factor BamB
MTVKTVSSKSPNLGENTLKLSLVLGLTLSLGLSGCASLSKLNPLTKDKGPKIVASQGERISIVAFEQKLAPSEGLKGTDFYIPPPQPVVNWPVGQGPEAGVEHANAAPDFKVAWTKSIGEGSSSKTQVLARPVSDGKLIIAMDGAARVRAFDIETGNEVWSRNLDPNHKRDRSALSGGLALSGDKVFVTSGFRFVEALSITTGDTLWTKTLETPVHSAPAVNSDLVFFTDVDNRIQAFSQATGEPSWTYQAIVEPARILRSSAPSVTNDLIIAPFSSGELIALNAKLGTPVWTQVLARTNRTNALSEIRDISGRPLIANGLVYAASHSGMFAAMDAKSGQRRWMVPADSTDSPWVAGDVVYLNTVQSELIAANATSGQVYWLADLNQGRAKTKASAFGLGAKKKNKDLPVWTGPFLASNRLIMVNSLGEMVAFDPKTGARGETLKIGKAIYLSPIAVGNKLFVVTNDARLVAIR